jgi:DNA topoisomerase IA
MRILCVAEKPSAAKKITEILSQGNSTRVKANFFVCILPNPKYREVQAISMCPISNSPITSTADPPHLSSQHCEGT